MSASKAAAGDGPYPLPEGWRWARLGEVATWGSGGTPKRSVSEYFGGSVPWLSISDLNDGNISESRECLTEAGLENSTAKIVPEGTIFVAMYGSIGKLGVAILPMATSQAIAWAIPDDRIVDRGYLFNFLLSQRSKLQSRGRGGTQSNIGQKDLKDWKIPLAPLSEQRRISELLDKGKFICAEEEGSLQNLSGLAGVEFDRRFGELQNVMVRLGDVVLGIDGGKSPKCESFPADSGNWGVLKLSAVTGGTYRPSENKAIFDEGSIDQKNEVSVGDVLMTRKNTPELVGEVCYVSETPEKLLLPDLVFR